MRPGKRTQSACSNLKELLTLTTRKEIPDVQVNTIYHTIKAGGRENTSSCDTEQQQKTTTTSSGSKATYLTTSFRDFGRKIRIPISGMKSYTKPVARMKKTRYQDRKRMVQIERSSYIYLLIISQT